MCLAGDGEDCRIAVRDRSLPPHRLAFVANEIAEQRHRDASRREGRPIDRGAGPVQAVLEGLRLAAMAALRMC